MRVNRTPGTDLPVGVPPSHNDDGRLCVRCPACSYHVACVMDFVGLVNFSACRNCRAKVTYERSSGETDGVCSLTRPRRFADSMAPWAKFACAGCWRVLLVGPAFSGWVDVLCRHCKKLSRLSGAGHTESIARKYIPYVRATDRPSGNGQKWTAEVLIPLLEARWEQFVKEKRRAQAEVAVGLRFDVFMRDGFRCRYCGRSVDDGIILQADHVLPVSKGGPTCLENLVAACFECNLGKSNKLLHGIAERARL